MLYHRAAAGLSLVTTALSFLALDDADGKLFAPWEIYHPSQHYRLPVVSYSVASSCNEAAVGLPLLWPRSPSWLWTMPMRGRLRLEHMSSERMPPCYYPRRSHRPCCAMRLLRGYLVVMAALSFPGPEPDDADADARRIATWSSCLSKEGRCLPVGKGPMALLWVEAAAGSLPSLVLDHVSMRNGIRLGLYAVRRNLAVVSRAVMQSTTKVFDQAAAATMALGRPSCPRCRWNTMQSVLEYVPS